MRILPIFIAASVFVALASPASFTVLHTFTRTGRDGAIPTCALLAGPGGILYGTTQAGGAYDGGIAFSLMPPAAAGGTWIESVLWNFGNATDGKGPSAGLIAGPAGVLYGVTLDGGANGSGTVFSLTPPSSAGGVWTEAVLWNFGAGADGIGPYGPLTMGSDRILYGTTEAGGSPGYGTVFSLTPPAPPGSPWTESVIWNFGGPGDGREPQNAGVTLGTGGVLYGATWGGGANGYGTVYSLSPPASPGGAWSERVLWSFGAASSAGENPFGGVAIDRSGSLYGTTFSGTVYSLTPPAPGGTAWALNDLHAFRTRDGHFPAGNLWLARDGNIFGTTYKGGTHNHGVVFRLNRFAAGWRETVLHDFARKHGAFPMNGVIEAAGGTFYGVTSSGGASEPGGSACGYFGCGTVFALKP